MQEASKFNTFCLKMYLVCIIGLIFMFYSLLKFVQFIVGVTYTALCGGRINFTQFGEWAVVTGCTDGIGKAYAKQLAAKGLNIMMISRNKAKLDDVASEIEKNYKVETKKVQVDFWDGHEIYEPIAKEIEGFEIGVLVNNVGIGADPHPGYLHELPTELIWRQVNTNVMSTAMITRLIIPTMVKRKKGIIINVTSFTAVAPYPLTGAYSSTKAFIDKFSESLEIEYGDKGIIVQSALALWVATNMSSLRPALFSPAPDVYVRPVLDKVGLSLRCFGYWPHELQAFLFLSLPRWLLVKIGFKIMSGLRERALQTVNEQKTK